MMRDMKQEALSEFALSSQGVHGGLLVGRESYAFWVMHAGATGPPSCGLCLRTL